MEKLKEKLKRCYLTLYEPHNNKYKITLRIGRKKIVEFKKEEFEDLYLLYSNFTKKELETIYKKIISDKIKQLLPQEK